MASLGPSDDDLRSQFRVFTLVWVIAGWFHIWNQVHWPVWTWWRPSADQVVLELGMLLAALAVVQLPRSTLPFLVFVSLEALHAGRDIPRVANHWYLTFLCTLAMLGSAAVVARRTGGLDGADWLRHAGPAVRWIVTLGYLFAAWAKLNTGFLDPDISCAAFAWDELRTMLTVLPTGPFWHALAMWGTVVIELAIPALLWSAHPHRGVLLGLAFHYLISIPPALHVPDFAFLLFATWSLFLPPAVAARMVARKRALLADAQRPRSLVVGLLAPMVLLPVLWYAIGPGAERAANALAWLRIDAFIVLGAAWCVWVLLHLRDDAGDVGEHVEHLLLRSTWHHVLVVLVVLTGLMPYVGLRTISNFAMFSNLRTEGGTNNHLLMPQVYVADHQLDLVEVQETTIEPLKVVMGGGRRLPRHELRHRYQTAIRTDPAAFVAFRDGGTTVRVSSPTEAPPWLTEPIPWWERRLLAFRAVPDGEGTCQR